MFKGRDNLLFGEATSWEIHSYHELLCIPRTEPLSKYLVERMKRIGKLVKIGLRTQLQYWLAHGILYSDCFGCFWCGCDAVVERHKHKRILYFCHPLYQYLLALCLNLISSYPSQWSTSFYIDFINAVSGCRFIWSFFTHANLSSNSLLEIFFLPSIPVH